ncbi:MAG: hypothetical protein KGL39_24005 [Patescibacteria group bacterium]|nr:hypothetical protein [Patescibacteria group bacterium]
MALSVLEDDQLFDELVDSLPDIGSSVGLMAAPYPETRRPVPLAISRDALVVKGDADGTTISSDGPPNANVDPPRGPGAAEPGDAGGLSPPRIATSAAPPEDATADSLFLFVAPPTAAPTPSATVASATALAITLPPAAIHPGHRDSHVYSREVEDKEFARSTFTEEERRELNDTKFMTISEVRELVLQNTTKENGSTFLDPEIMRMIDARINYKIYIAEDNVYTRDEVYKHFPFVQFGVTPESIFDQQELGIFPPRRHAMNKDQFEYVAQSITEGSDDTAFVMVEDMVGAATRPGYQSQRSPVRRVKTKVYVGNQKWDDFILMTRIQRGVSTLQAKQITGPGTFSPFSTGTLAITDGTPEEVYRRMRAEEEAKRQRELKELEKKLADDIARIENAVKLQQAEKARAKNAPKAAARGQKPPVPRTAPPVPPPTVSTPAPTVSTPAPTPPAAAQTPAANRPQTAPLQRPQAPTQRPQAPPPQRPPIPPVQQFPQRSQAPPPQRPQTPPQRSQAAPPQRSQAAPPQRSQAALPQRSQAPPPQTPPQRPVVPQQRAPNQQAVQRPPIPQQQAQRPVIPQQRPVQQQSSQQPAQQPQRPPIPQQNAPQRLSIPQQPQRPAQQQSAQRPAQQPQRPAIPQSRPANAVAPQKPPIPQRGPPTPQQRPQPPPFNSTASNRPDNVATRAILDSVFEDIETLPSATDSVGIA